MSTTATSLRLARFAVVGNPNVGKTSLFNALTGLNQRIGNYPGVTVDKKLGRVELDGTAVELVDLPGIYALSPHSPDEMVAFSVLTQSAYDMPLDGLLVLLDASNLERNLYLFSQVLALNLPTIAVLNMLDVAEAQALKVDVARLEAELGVPVIAVNAAKKSGIAELRAAMARMVAERATPRTPAPDLGAAIAAERDALVAWLGAHGEQWGPLLAERLLIDDGGHLERELLARCPEAAAYLEGARERVGALPVLAAHEARVRYRWVHERLADVLVRPKVRVTTFSERIDTLLTHKVFGLLLFAFVMALVFQSIYAWSAPLQDGITAAFSHLGTFVGAFLPDGAFKSLLVDGVINGIGTVVTFLPQIAILFLFIGILEDCGYMARAAFLMDRVMGKAGLSGKSFIPMLSGFACAVPSIMATRTIENRRDRLATIMALPLMSCSARLPVYTVLIGAFIPAGRFLGMDTRGLVLFAIYILGAVLAIPLIWVLKRSVLRGATPTILLELPTYKLPSWRVVGLRVWHQSGHFLERAGSTIFFVAVIVWAAAYFPHNPAIAQRFAPARAALAPTQVEQLHKLDAAEDGAYIEDSYLARAGRTIAPAFAPLGWDWRITTGVMASFPAREVIVSTLGTLYSLGGDVEAGDGSLRDALRAGKRPDGSPEFTIPVALSVMVFFALCLQCASTLVVMWRETGSWRWPALAFTAQTMLAYVAALVTYQLGRLWL
ncbi:MAG TPA: ferrous iron transport protein B [Oscillatoriaceae cyanobacterium]